MQLMAQGVPDLNTLSIKYIEDVQCFAKCQKRNNMFSKDQYGLESILKISEFTSSRKEIVDSILISLLKKFRETLNQ